MDPEPPQPQWLVQSNLMTTVATLLAAESSQGQLENNTTQESAGNLFQELINSFDNAVPWVFFSFFSFGITF